MYVRLEIKILTTPHTPFYRGALHKLLIFKDIGSTTTYLFKKKSNIEINRQSN